MSIPFDCAVENRDGRMLGLHTQIFCKNYYQEASENFVMLQGEFLMKQVAEVGMGRWDGFSEDILTGRAMESLLPAVFPGRGEL